MKNKHQINTTKNCEAFFKCLKGILHQVEFSFYARRFLSDIIATQLTRCKIECSETSEQRTTTGLKKFTVIERCCPLLAGNFKKIIMFWTKHFVRYSRHFRYLGCLLLGGFTVVKNKPANVIQKQVLLSVGFRIQGQEKQKIYFINVDTNNEKV